MPIPFLTILSQGKTFQVNANGADDVFRIRQPGNVYMTFDDTTFRVTDAKAAIGTAEGRWSEIFAATGSINTSDAREKTSVASPDEALMRAWSKVDFKSFQFTDAVEKKGSEEARIHFGVVAQQVAEAFASEGLDASRYALFCYDKWDEQQAEYDPETGEEITPYRPAGDRYGIRYSEALALECAYQRWLGEKREARIAALEARLN